MRTDDEQPTLKDWRDAYEVAQRIKEVEPWRYMEETDIFAVQHPEAEGLGFPSVMGQLGEHFAVSVYLGSEGLYAFWDAQDADLFTYPNRLLEMPQLMLSLEDRGMLEDRDRRLIKQVGLTFRGRNAWPLFRSYRPGFMPWHWPKKTLHHGRLQSYHVPCLVRCFPHNGLRRWIDLTRSDVSSRTGRAPMYLEDVKIDFAVS